MSSSERAAELRRLAEHYESIGDLEEAAVEAKRAYRSDPDDPDAKAAHAEAKLVLREARRDVRESGVMVGDSTPGSVTIVPQGISGKVG